MSIDTSAILAGVRILDCTRNIAGPVATMFAAEMGADVIKVEPPGGDEMRQWPPFVDGESAYFVSCNRGKRSIVLDLKTDDGRQLFGRLLHTADVLVENYRPGTLEKLGLGWSDIHPAFPKLVWVSVSGYGRSGPRAGAPGSARRTCGSPATGSRWPTAAGASVRGWARRPSGSPTPGASARAAT